MVIGDVSQSSQCYNFWSVRVLLSVLQVQLFTFYLYFRYNFFLVLLLVAFSQYLYFYSST